jgi:hypothetical protein
MVSNPPKEDISTGIKEHIQFNYLAELMSNINLSDAKVEPPREGD